MSGFELINNLTKTILALSMKKVYDSNTCTQRVYILFSNSFNHF